jgi:DNA-binding winged helix-turn-helix (wHTH) protein/TolB-like protein/Flp pilus assembly protein TadD
MVVIGPSFRHCAVPGKRLQNACKSPEARSMKAHEQVVYRFGGFVLVPAERLLLWNAAAVALTGKAFDLLVALVRQAGHLLTKDELLAAVWPQVVVEEVNLSVNISALRKVLATAPGGERWIENVPRQGYRFVAAVEVGDMATFHPAGVGPTAPQALALDAERRDATPAAGPRFSRRQLALGAGSLAAAGLVTMVGVQAWRGRTPYASVAVLPFTVDAPANAYLADGLAEGVIHGLTRVQALRVTPRASAFRFKGTEADPTSVGRSLDAATVVTGALSQRSEAVRLHVELVDVARNAQVWSHAYDVAAADLPLLEGRLLHDLARALRVALSPAEGSGLTRPPTTNTAAYEAYLRGRHLWNQRSEASLHAAIEQFRRAIDLDPPFALAHAGLADAHTTLGYLGYVPPVSTFPLGRPHALKALQLDPTLSQAHASLAYIKFYFDWDWDGARQEFRRAIELNPNDPVAHQWHAVYLLAAGQDRQAFSEVQLAHHLDPLSLAINTDIGFHHYYGGRYKEALAQLDTVLAMKADFVLAHLWRGRTLLQMGRYDEALAAAASVTGKLRDWPVIVTARGFALGMAGRIDEARAVLREMQALAQQRFVTAYGMALVHTGLGQKDEAFAWLDKAFAERSHWLVWLRRDPRWNRLRDDRRFAPLVERLRYPTAS